MGKRRGVVFKSLGVPNCVIAPSLGLNFSAFENGSPCWHLTKSSSSVFSVQPFAFLPECDPAGCQ